MCNRANARLANLDMFDVSKNILGIRIVGSDEVVVQILNSLS